MNTVDPNEKVATTAAVAEHHESTDTAPASNGNVEVAASAEVHESDAAAQPANLPKYHHHRSTALW